MNTPRPNEGGKQVASVEERFDRRELLAKGLRTSFLVQLLAACKTTDDKKVDRGPRTDVPAPVVPKPVKVEPKPEPKPEKTEEEKELEKMTAEMPKIEFLDEKVSYPKPKELEHLSDDEYVQACYEFAYNVVQNLVPKLKESFEMHPNFKNPNAPRQQLFIHFILGAVEDGIKNPVFKAYLEKHKSSRDMFHWAKLLKPLLLAGGYYFSLNRIGSLDPDSGKINGSTELRLYSHQGEKIVKLKDEVGETKAQIYQLGEKVFNLDEFSKPGFYDPDLNIGLVSVKPGKAASKIDLLMDSGVLTERPKDVEKLQKQYDRDTEVHEATHVLVGDRYELARKTDLNHLFMANLPKITINEQGTFTVPSGVYAPIHFQEMCAVGNEIFHGNTKLPISGLMYFGGGNSLGYVMVRKVLPMLALKVMVESPIKEEIVNRFKAGMEINDAVVARSIFENFTPFHWKKLGYLLYKMGIDCLEKAQKGEFQKVALQ